MKVYSKRKTFILCVLIVFLVATFEGCWFFLKKYFDGVSLDSIIFTAHTMAISTVESRLIKGFFIELIYAYTAGIIILTILFCPLELKLGERHILPIKQKSLLPFSLLLLVGMLIHISINLDIPLYIANKNTKTTLYDQYYIPPEKIKLTFPNKKRNLIIIYMESIESTYTSRDLGGWHTYNLIPNLSALALENINFSNSDKIGGPENLKGTSWTVAGIFGSLSGIPLSIPIYDNCYSGLGTFAPGATSLGDILKGNGYDLTFIMGSDSTFGGRQNFLKLHGDFNILDYDNAVEDGVIPNGYHVWWGYEDKYLYKYAKDTLRRLWANNKPFCLMMLTADTHHIGGYVCSKCTAKYPDQFENVIACADVQIADFIAWIKNQRFYKDTSIVILGDHCSMDPDYFDELDNGNIRRPYNAFINSSVRNIASTKNREFTTLDFYPTILASIGVKIDGDRLGLGTNLFSGKQTLAEKIGISTIQHELSKNSDYYYDKILYGEPK